MEKDDHFTQTQIPLLSHSVAHGSKVAALGSPSFSLLLSFSALSHSRSLLLSHPRGNPRLISGLFCFCVNKGVAT